MKLIIKREYMLTMMAIAACARTVSYSMQHQS